MITEYFYWTLPTYLEVQKDRLDEISEEQKFNTKEKKKKILLMMRFMNNQEFKISKVTPSFKINQKILIIFDL